jgi:spore maturation protein CgeB
MPKARLVPADSPLRRLRRLPKLTGDKLCVLLVENGYHLQKECRRALTQMGHRVVSMTVGVNGSSAEPSATLDMFLKTVVEHQPDMMLTIDGLGFDRVDWMSEVVDAIGLPTAVWYVDSPYFIALGVLNPAPEHTTTFSWDRSYLPLLRANGMRRVHHLPLATDTSVFHPGARPGPKRYPIAFVGHALTDLVERWRGRLTPQEREHAAALCATLTQDRHAMVPLAAQCRPPIDRYSITLAYANFHASKDYRLGILQALPQRRLHIFGDKDWPDLLPHAHTHRGFGYGAPLAEVFRQTHINVNATNLQMPGTVNQRVFDVPACAGLLLTDRQAELEDYFEPGREILVYDSPEHAAHLAHEHAAQPKLAEAIGDRALQRVVSEHTYTHRLTALLQIMRQEHARGTAQPLQPAARGQRPAPAVEFARKGSEQPQT